MEHLDREQFKIFTFHRYRSSQKFWRVSRVSIHLFSVVDFSFKLSRKALSSSDFKLHVCYAETSRKLWRVLPQSCVCYFLLFLLMWSLNFLHSFHLQTAGFVARQYAGFLSKTLVERDRLVNSFWIFFTLLAWIFLKVLKMSEFDSLCGNVSRRSVWILMLKLLRSLLVISTSYLNKWKKKKYWNNFYFSASNSFSLSFTWFSFPSNFSNFQQFNVVSAPLHEVIITPFQAWAVVSSLCFLCVAVFVSKNLFTWQS